MQKHTQSAPSRIQVPAKRPIEKICLYFLRRRLQGKAFKTPLH